MVYEKQSDGTFRIESVPFSNRRFVASHTSAGTSFDAQRHITDHLGSVRCIVNSAGLVIEQNDYTPFGLRFNIPSYPRSSNRYLFNGKEEVFAGLLDYGARIYDPITRRWITQDPLAEKYYSISPYTYCANNPVRYIDPFGMDIYRYDRKTGLLNLEIPLDDGFDHIGIFEYDKNTRKYNLKRKKNGEGRFLIQKIEDGILEDQMNLMENDYVWQVGGEGQPTVEGFQKFVAQFADLVGREIGGAYFTGLNGGEISYIYMKNFKSNTYNSALIVKNAHETRSDLVGRAKPHTMWHTHPSYAPIEDRLRPSGPDRKAKLLSISSGYQYFIILTPGQPPIFY